MDAKRIIPILQVRAGRVVGQDAAPAGGVSPAEWACRLEREGADGILFRQADPVDGRAEWIGEVAGSLSIPFSLEAPFRGFAELEEAMAAGVDKLILSAPSGAEDALLAAAAQAFGRTRVAVAVDAVLAAGAHWRVELADEPEGRDALAWMLELEQRGAGEILLRTTPEGPAMAELFQGAARLALSILFLSQGDEAEAAEALLHGADGVAFPAAAGSPGQWKSALSAHGLAIRQ